MFFKNLIIGLACLIVSAFASYWLATEDYTSLILIGMGCFVMITVLVPGYSFLFAFGLLCPFIFPLPFVFAFPTIAVALGLIAFKYISRRSLSASKTAPHFSVLTAPILIFFGMVLFQYCLHPVLPGLALGLNNDVSGFRSYAIYGIIFSMLFLMGYIFVTREGLIKVIHAMAIISLFFIVLLMPLMFTKSLMIAQILSQFGVFVTAFDTGIFRFVALPGFGLILLTLGFLPHLISLTKGWRVAMILLGIGAVILGGSRSSFTMALIIIIVIPLVKKRFFQFAAVTAAAVLFLVTIHFITENSKFNQVGFLRIFSLTSSRLAQSSDAEGNQEWRMVRWTRAWEEIKQHPFTGRGYGGLQNILFLGRNLQQQTEEDSIEIALATGGVHNGYLASALALGVPFTLLFIFIFISQLKFNLSEAYRHLDTDPQLREFHAFVFVSLFAFAIAFYVGADVSDPTMWFYVGIGILTGRIKQAELLQQRLAPHEMAIKESNRPSNGSIGDPITQNPVLSGHAFVTHKIAS